jgi:hypothetical protein
MLPSRVSTAEVADESTFPRFGITQHPEAHLFRQHLEPSLPSSRLTAVKCAEET